MGNWPKGILWMRASSSHCRMAFLLHIYYPWLEKNQTNWADVMRWRLETRRPSKPQQISSAGILIKVKQFYTRSGKIGRHFDRGILCISRQGIGTRAGIHYDEVFLKIFLPHINSWTKSFLMYLNLSITLLFVQCQLPKNFI
jgi:hypothetical protein